MEEIERRYLLNPHMVEPYVKDYTCILSGLICHPYTS